MHNVLKQRLFVRIAQIANLMKAAFFVVAMSTCFAATSPEVEFCFAEIGKVTPTEIKEIKLKQLAEREKTVFASREEYIKHAIENAKVADSIAINMGHKTVPLAISVAQACLESRFGESNLTKKSKNHFGIKATKAWLKAKHPTVKAHDDTPNDLFCKFESDLASFTAHAVLLNKSNYKKADVFKYNPNTVNLAELKDVATRVKRAGYATDPNYPQAVMELIKQYKIIELIEASNS